MDITEGWPAARELMAIRKRRERSVEAGEGVGDAGDHIAVDELLLSSSGVAESGGGEAVDLAQRALGQLVQDGESVIGEQVALTAGGAETEADVLGRVGDGGRGEQEAVMDAREQRAMGASGEVGFELGEADEDQREQGFGVPLIIEQDVQVSHHVGMEQVRLVEEEDRMELVASHLVDVSLDSEKEVGGGGGGLEPEGVAEVAVEVAPSESGIVTVGQPKACLGESMAQCAQNTGFADARLAEEQDAVFEGEGLFDIGDEGGLALGQPEVGVVDLLGKRGGPKTEAVQVRRARQGPPPRLPCSRPA